MQLPLADSDNELSVSGPGGVFPSDAVLRWLSGDTLRIPSQFHDLFTRDGLKAILS